VGTAMSDRQAAILSELAARYLCGWTPKPFGKRRFPRLERAIGDAWAEDREALHVDTAIECALTGEELPKTP